jgi:hypothetical protein
LKESRGERKKKRKKEKRKLEKTLILQRCLETPRNTHEVLQIARTHTKHANPPEEKNDHKKTKIEKKKKEQREEKRRFTSQHNGDVNVLSLQHKKKNKAEPQKL